MLLQSNSFTIKLLNNLSSEMGLFTLLNCIVPYVQLDYLKSYILESKSRPPIPEFLVLTVVD